MREGKRILTDQLVDTPISAGYAYGLGCWGYRVEPGTNRLLLASSPGAYGFIPWIDLDRNLVGVLAANSNYDAVDPYWGRILAILSEPFPVP